MIYLFLRADEYLAAERLAALKAALGDPETAGLNISEFEANSSASDIAGIAAMMPFLAEKRLVIVRGYLDALERRLVASKKNDSAAHHEVAYLLEELPGLAGESADVVFVDQNVDKTKALWKGLVVAADAKHPERKLGGLEGWVKAKHATLEQLLAPSERDLPGWVQQRSRAKGIQIGGSAVALLARFVGPDLRRLDNELDKLSLYAWKRPITDADIHALVADASEEKIWTLTDALCQRNPSVAARTLHELLQDKEQNPIGLLSSIAKQYRLLIAVKSAQGHGAAPADAIAAQLGERPFPVEKAMKLTGRYSFTELITIMERLLLADVAMKSGTDPATELQMVMAELALNAVDIPQP